MMAVTEIANRVFRQMHNGGDTCETVTYTAVPGGEMARWLLPAASAEIRDVLASWAPYRLWSRVAWTAVRAASQLGRLAEVPGASVLEVEGTRGADWASLGWRWGDEPIPVIYLGTPGPRRKAAVHLVDRASGKCRAVVKVPLTDEAEAAVLHEAEVLETLAKERYPFSPRLLFVDRARGISTQTFVEGCPGGRTLTPEFRRLLRGLVLPGETTTLEEHADECSREFGLVKDNAPEIDDVAAAIEELRDRTPLPACWEHGDFSPWNIKRAADGDCALLDWEDARRNGLPLQDAFHFLHMQDFLFGGRPRLHAAEVREDATGTGVPPRQIRQLETAYLIRSYLRCLRKQNHERAYFVSRALGLRKGKAA